MKKYTIKDIAQLAGVSKGTIDRVIHKRGNVAKDVEEKVKQLLEDINYQPNLIARNLKNNKVFNITVLLPDPKKDPYWEACFDGLETALHEFSAFNLSVHTILFDPTDTNSFLESHEEVLASAPDVVLMVPLFYKESKQILQRYEELGLKVCTFNNQISGSKSSFIGQDLFQSGRVAAKLLHSINNSGDFAIVHVDEKYKNAVHMQEKERGFLSYFDELEDFNHSIIKYKLKYGDNDESLNHFLNKHQNLTGIFVTNSKGFNVARVLKSVKKEQIRLVGYDLIAANIKYLKSGTIDFLIHQNPRHQAYLGMKFLIEHLVFEKAIPDQHLLPIDIINSENVAPFLRN